MPDARSRSRAAAAGPRRALAALWRGVAPVPDGVDEALHHALVAVVLRLVFLRCAGDRPDTRGWPALRAHFARWFDTHGVALLDPARHPVLADITISDDALTRAVQALGEHTELGAAHEALLAVQPGPARRSGSRDLHDPDAAPTGPDAARRRSGSHYTPAALTGPLVAAALGPLLAERSAAADVLDLRVCDPAMGCGAVLLAACDALASHLLRSSPVPGDSTHARRQAAQCLYGVDLDPLAVELARLSLWLHVGDRTLPPTAFAAQLRHGDSLVGLSSPQIAALTWERPTGRPGVDDVEGTSRGSTRPIDPTADDGVARLRLRGDAVLAAFFAGARPAAREQARRALSVADDDALVDLGAALRARAIYPFHWALEFPSVFTREAPGFDAMLGNPPFFWGNRIGRCFGDAYRDWLQQLHPGAHGNSDLAAHFLRRAFDLLRPGGTLGFITTNSICEAETRVTGLEHVRARGGVIHEAVRDLAWPGDASVRIARVCLRRGPVPGPHLLDGRPVPGIGDDLRPLHAGAAPRRLPARAGQSFKGVDFGGTGFLLTAAAREALLREAPDEAAFVWPVLNASGFTTSPTLTPAGHIINFSGLDLAGATAAAPRCLEIVAREVLPRRLVDRRGSRRARWWLYNEACPGLYRAISGLPRVLVGPVVAKHLVFGFVAPRTVFTNALNVFTFAGADALAVLQSRVHELWALRHASSLRSDPRYNPSTCFETFPFPPTTVRLTEVGAAYDEHRGAVMRARGEGLTGTYNRFHDPAERDPAIARLRELHAALDHAVLTAFAWPDLAAAARCEFQQDPGAARWRLRWPQALLDEVHARLLEINHHE